MPSSLQVPAGNKAFLAGHAVGTQAYICLPSGWTFYGPQATLFDGHDKQLTTHCLSPNRAESGAVRATWQHSRDTSAVWALAIACYAEADFVEPGAIPWLLLRVVGAADGPTGGDELTETTFIQRLTTDYFFYKAAKATRTTRTSPPSRVPALQRVFSFRSS